MTRREFSPATKEAAFEREDGRCVDCRVTLTPATGIEFDHGRPTGWLGGDNSVENCFPRCRNCHTAKTSREAGDRGRGNHARRRHLGIENPWKRKPPGSKGSGWRKPLNGPAYRVNEETGERIDPPAKD